MKMIFAIYSALLIAGAAYSAEMTFQLTPISSGEFHVIDIGMPIHHVNSCTLQLSGSSMAGMLVCEGPGGSYEYSCPYYISGGFVEGGYLVGGYFGRYGLSNSIHILEANNWSFLCDDGSASYCISWERECEASGGWCFSMPWGYVEFTSVTMTIIYEELVANESSTWGAIKSCYR